MRPPRQLGTLTNYITGYDSYTLLLLFINVVYRRGRKVTTFFRSFTKGCIPFTKSHYPEYLAITLWVDSVSWQSSLAARTGDSS
jgi:hypothetical protein